MKESSSACLFGSLLSCVRVCFSCFLMSVLTLVLKHWFKQCCTSCGPPRAVAMLGRMIALHHRMSQNAGDMMQLIQETLNQADEAHSRRHRDGQGRWQQYVHGRSLPEPSWLQAPAPVGTDEVTPPGSPMSTRVNPASPTDPPPPAGFQSAQSHADHRRNVAVNPKSLSYCIITADTNDPTDLRSKSPMVHDYVGQPGFKKANVPRSIMDKGEADRRRTKRKRGRTTSSKKTDSPEPPARPAPCTPAPAPVSPCPGLVSSPESVPEPPAHPDAGNPGTPPEAPRAWTEEDDQQLCSLKADNRSKFSYKSLAKKLNRSIAERLRKAREQHQKTT